MRRFILLFLLSPLALAESSFDLRDYYSTTSPKKQSWGTCWAFATVASLESNILSERSWPYGGTPDLSEYHMDKYSGFSRKGHNDHVKNESYSGQGERFPGSNSDNPEEGLLVHVGGDYKIATAYLSNVGGAVEEFKTPAIGFSHDYHERFGDLPSEGVKLKNDYRYFQPDSIEWITWGSFEENIERIKKSLRKHGSVASAQFMKNDPHELTLSGEEVHFYHGYKEPTHAVNIIGWDDERAIIPFEPGVWIVQDSDHLDEVSGHIGYFLTPYADQHTGQNPEFGGVSFRGTKERSFKKIHSHSLHGWQYEFFAKKIANKYKLGNEVPSHVGTYTVSPGDSVIVFVKNEKGDLLCYSTRLDKKNPGYYLIPLICQEDAFKPGTYTVEVETGSGLYAHDGNKVYKPLLSQMPEFGSPLLVGSKAMPDQSFYEREGEWKDLYEHRWEPEVQYGKEVNINRSANFAINLFTK